MTFNQLKEQMKKFNETYYVRFATVGDSLEIKGYRHAVPFTENDYSKAEELVTTYSMFKPDALCRGVELYYKGLKWNDLSKEQQDSLVEYSKANCEKYRASGMCSESEYEECFNNSKVFYYY